MEKWKNEKSLKNGDEFCKNSTVLHLRLSFQQSYGLRFFTFALNLKRNSI